MWLQPGSATRPKDRAQDRHPSHQDAVVAGDKAKAERRLPSPRKKLDKAASKGVIHKNQAANRKSAIAKKVAVALTH